MFHSGRSMPEPLQNKSKKINTSIFRCFFRRKSKSCSQMRQESRRETGTRTEASVENGISTIASTLGSPVMSKILNGGHLEHSPNLRNMRLQMNGAQFSKRRNTLSKRVSKIQIGGVQKTSDIEYYHKRCENLNEEGHRVMPVNTEDEDNLNRTAPVVPEAMSLTMDESKRELRASQEVLSRKGSRAWTRAGRAVTASEESNPVELELAKATEASRDGWIQNETRAMDILEDGGSIFSDLLKISNLAIDYLEKEIAWNLNQIQYLSREEFKEKKYTPVKNEIHQANILSHKLVEARTIIEQRLKAASAVPKVVQKSSLTPPPPIRTEHRHTTPDGPDHGSPGSKRLQRTLRISTPTASGGARLSEHSPPNWNSPQTPDTQQPTLESIARKSFSRGLFSTHRNLDGIPVGMNNSNNGTTCYINAGLQLLASVPQIISRVEEGIEFRNDNGNSDMEACAAYKKFIKERRRETAKPNKTLINAITNRAVANVMFKLYPGIFMPNREEDCMEFITTLLQKIDEELGEELGPRSLFTGAQRRYYTKEDGGTDRSNSPPPLREEVNYVLLPFTAQHRTIEDAFDSYTTQQRSLDERSHHWYKFEELPSLLLIHVQSYDDARPIPQKALRNVPIKEILQFKEEWMYKVPAASEGSYRITVSAALEDMASRQETSTPPRYVIRAVVFHDGHETTTGHYTAAVFLPDCQGRRVCYHCDDTYVKSYSWNDLDRKAKDSQVTVLLYEREG